MPRNRNRYCNPYMMILLVDATSVGTRPETKLQVDTSGHGQYDDIDEYIKTCEKCLNVCLKT